MLGELGVDGSVTGTSTFADLAGDPQSGPIDITAFELASHGRLSAIGPMYDEQVGANFLQERGYPVGSLFGRFDGVDPATDLLFFIQRHEGDLVSWVFQLHEYQYIEFSDAGVEFLSGSFYRPEGSEALEWTPDGGQQSSIGINNQDADGTLHLADGRAVYTSAGTALLNQFTGLRSPGALSLIVDTDNSDGRIGVGIARRSNVTFLDRPEGLHGVYRASIITSGAVGAAFFGAEAVSGDVGAAQVVIELDFRGSYRIYGTGAYDTGDRTVLSSGTWDVPTQTAIEQRLNSLRLTAGDGSNATFMVTHDFALVPRAARSADGTSADLLMGSATTFNRYPVENFLIGGSVALGAGGRPIYYEAVLNDPWFATDLIENWGGEPVVQVGSTPTFDNSTHHMVVGVTADGDVVVWDRTHTGRWMFRNLSEELAAEGIVSNIAIFPYRAPSAPNGFNNTLGALAIAGFTADGDLMLYTPSLFYDRAGQYEWDAVNLTDEELTPAGRSTPAWTGNVTGYHTFWGGLNIVGLNAGGDIEVVWTAPAATDEWYTNNLSQSAGTPALDGPISILLTSWSGIHIHALDSQGALHVTWWVPELQGEWVHTNLTVDAGGPLFDTTRTDHGGRPFLAFFGSTMNLNIVGFDANGRVRVYWWQPGFTSWEVGDLTSSVPVAQMPRSLAAASQLGATSSQQYFIRGQSLYGYKDDGSFVRAWWAGGGPDVWHADNLTEIAVPLLT